LMKEDEVMNLRDIGWVWEGQGLDPGVEPSIFGVGEGCEYFGLSRAWYMFHPNTELAMRKLAGLDEVICDITKWEFKEVDYAGAAHTVDARPQRVISEAALVSQLSRQFPNITGAVHDDMLGLTKREDFSPAQYTEVYRALKSENPTLKLWAVVYSHELDANQWADFRPFMDVISLWVWEAKNLRYLDEYIEKCRELFPEKPLIMGCYLREYAARAPVPMEMVKHQWETLLRHIQAGTLDGYSILGAVLIDSHQQQANWIRDSIAANS